MPETFLVGTRAFQSEAFGGSIRAVGRISSLAVLVTMFFWWSDDARAGVSGSTPDVPLPVLDAIRAATPGSTDGSIAIGGLANVGPMIGGLTPDLEALDLLLREDRQGEIGRASCRERVFRAV